MTLPILSPIRYLLQILKISLSSAYISHLTFNLISHLVLQSLRLNVIVDQVKHWVKLIYPVLQMSIPLNIALLPNIRLLPILCSTNNIPRCSNSIFISRSPTILKKIKWNIWTSNLTSVLCILSRRRYSLRPLRPFRDLDLFNLLWLSISDKLEPTPLRRLFQIKLVDSWLVIPNSFFFQLYLLLDYFVIFIQWHL